MNKNMNKIIRIDKGNFEEAYEACTTENGRQYWHIISGSFKEVMIIAKAFREIGYKVKHEYKKK